MCHLPTHEIKAKISAGGLLEDVVAEELGDANSTETQLYSDGSTIDGKVGAAAVMYRGGQEVKSLRLHLGSVDEHTMFKAEAVGVILSLHLLSYEWDSRNASIKLDNQAVLAAILIHKPKPAQTLIDEIILQVDTIWTRMRDLAFQLNIGWVKGHSGERGNERADGEAKVAATG